MIILSNTCIPQWVFGPDPPDPPPLETHFFEVLREVGGGQKMTPPFFGSKIMNLLVFFYFEPKKCFRVRTPWGLYGAEWDKRSCSLCTFQPFLVCWRFW